MTASYGGSTRSVIISLLPLPIPQSLSCSPSYLASGSSSTCTVTLSNADGGTVSITTSNNGALRAPATVKVAAGSTSASFAVTAHNTGTNWYVISASLNGFTKMLMIATYAPSTSGRVTSLLCSPRAMSAGSSSTCNVQLDGVDPEVPTDVVLSASSSAVKLPERILARPGQTSVDFRLDAGEGEGSATAEIVAEASSGSARDTVEVSSRRPALRVPGPQFVRAETALRFVAAAADPATTVSVDGLPPGAAFDGNTGGFEWTPNAAQTGTYEVTFSAPDAAGSVVTKAVAVTVESGAPVITRVVNAASRSSQMVCSAGSIGSVEGRWLAASDADATGTELRIDGVVTPLLQGSSTRLDFACPDAVPGSEVHLVVETPQGVSQPMAARISGLTPGLYSVNGSGAGEALVIHADTGALAGMRNYASSAYPAQAGDALLAYATGIAGASGVAAVIGGVEVLATAEPVDGSPGLFQLAFQVPAEVSPGDRVSLVLRTQGPDGVPVDSNAVSLTIEAQGGK